MSGKKKERPFCAWCGVVRVKLMKNECCDESCAASLRWERMKAKGTIRTFEKASANARQSALFRRVQNEFESACRKLGVTPTNSIRQLYVESRNKGYHNGFMTATKRIGRTA